MITRVYEVIITYRDGNDYSFNSLPVDVVTGPTPQYLAEGLVSMGARSVEVYTSTGPRVLLASAGF